MKKTKENVPYTQNSEQGYRPPQDRNFNQSYQQKNINTQAGIRVMQIGKSAEEERPVDDEKRMIWMKATVKVTELRPHITKCMINNKIELWFNFILL